MYEYPINKAEIEACLSVNPLTPEVCDVLVGAAGRIVANPDIGFCNGEVSDPLDFALRLTNAVTSGLPFGEESYSNGLVAMAQEITGDANLMLFNRTSNYELVREASASYFKALWGYRSLNDYVRGASVGGKIASLPIGPNS